MRRTTALASSVTFLNAPDINNFAINKPYKNMEHCFKSPTFEIFPSSRFLILVSNKIIGISQYKTNGLQTHGPLFIKS